MKTRDLSNYLDELLRIRAIEDDSINGLQVENGGKVEKVALAVDASAAAMERARDLDADFLFVHHGLFWGKPVPLTGSMYQRIRLLVESDIALYSAHLPLDLHPEVGNNAQIQKVLGWPTVGDFGEYHGTLIGKAVCFKEPVPFSAIVNQLRDGFQCEPIVWDFGSEKVERLGYVSGGGLSMLEQAIEAGMDAYITGEPKHTFYWTAKEARINVVFAGHYATETLGVKAVGEDLRKKFGLETVFIDLPTGL